MAALWPIYTHPSYVEMEWVDGSHAAEATNNLVALYTLASLLWHKLSRAMEVTATINPFSL